MYRDSVNITHYYHLYNRGNGKKRIFHNHADFTKMIAILTNFKQIWQIKIPTYCIMPNHFHLLTGGIKNLNQIAGFMRCIQISYSRYYNRKYNCSGHVFSGPYKRKDIKTRQHLQTVAQYIMENPVRKGLVGEAGKWPYSGGFKW